PLDPFVLDPAVDLVGRRIQHRQRRRLGAHGLEDVERAERVVLEVVPRIDHRRLHCRLTGELDDRVDVGVSADHIVDGRAVADMPAIERQARRRPLKEVEVLERSPAGEVVDADDFRALAAQYLRRKRSANEASHTGYQKLHDSGSALAIAVRYTGTRLRTTCSHVNCRRTRFGPLTRNRVDSPGSLRTARMDAAVASAVQSHTSAASAARISSARWTRSEITHGTPAAIASMTAK